MRMAKLMKEKRQLELQRMQDSQRDKVNSFFTKYDKEDDGLLNEKEIANLLFSLTGVEPCQGALALAMSEGKKCNPEYATTRRAGVSKHSANEVIAKVSAYVLNQEALEPLFLRVDSNNDGAIDSKELLPLLQVVAEGSGFDPTHITYEDADVIMQMCDMNDSGDIERPEILFACATWKQLLERGAAPHQRAMGGPVSKACVLL